MKRIKKVLPALMSVCVLAANTAFAELTAIDDAELSDAVAQGGLYLSGELSLNEDGGPISDATYGTCSDVANGTSSRCGARFSYKIGGNADNGWYVIDDWKGELSFEGLTIRTRRIDGNQRDVTGQLVDNSGQPVDEANAVALGANDGFGGDGASFDQEVLEIGLPSTVKFKDYQYNVGYASHASPNDSASFQQTNIYGVRINGQVNMSGNLLIFPTADK
ncbi:hypothetical protein [Litoribrevibacter albus]|uniref:Porin n=1 Tax=Litoribrevibacter albus TaxID=1473156 RepID=A0AA37W8V7_9GAMM|nr:hypothetical protein [Litoribrevibacter albus]GLQ32444.1 hypothetical protein GCM10007876_29230 [Litoribrevibacter albus]